MHCPHVLFGAGPRVGCGDKHPRPPGADTGPLDPEHRTPCMSSWRASSCPHSHAPSSRCPSLGETSQVNLSGSSKGASFYNKQPLPKMPTHSHDLPEQSGTLHTAIRALTGWGGGQLCCTGRGGGQPGTMEQRPPGRGPGALRGPSPESRETWGGDVGPAGPPEEETPSSGMRSVGSLGPQAGSPHAGIPFSSGVWVGISAPARPLCPSWMMGAPLPAPMPPEDPSTPGVSRPLS